MWFNCLNACKVEPGLVAHVLVRSRVTVVAGGLASVCHTWVSVHMRHLTLMADERKGMASRRQGVPCPWKMIMSRVTSWIQSYLTGQEYVNGRYRQRCMEGL